ncbi:MAG: glutathione S-transferase N-terminal domain-containing protein [Alphaproteobacteria bacterium]|jgi:GST-like protein|nr:glutathione S-transferase N-terminal domain-containing protein [Alphaproteobacteria bacterium]
MIDLYTAATPNGQKIHIMLEECGLEYAEHWISLGEGEQFDAKFLAISPNNKIPAILDHDGPGGEPISVFESGAILFYLAEKTGRFLPTEPRARTLVMEWLMWQMGGFGPMLGQAHHFNKYAPERIKYAMDRYTHEASRLYGVLDSRLSEHRFVAGDYSIADMAIFPWCRLYQRQGQDIENFPNVMRWFAEIAARPAVSEDMAKLEDKAGTFTKESWSNLFGQEQYRRR